MRNLLTACVTALLALVAAPLASAWLAGPLLAQGAPATEQAVQRPGGEANLLIPDLGSVQFFGLPGDTLLTFGLIVCALGLLFGLVIYSRLKRLPVHQSMREISELIYET